MRNQLLQSVKSLKTYFFLTAISVLSMGSAYAQTCAQVTTFPYVQGFDTTALPACWTASAGTGYAYLWGVTSADATNGVAAPQSGSGFAYFDVYDATVGYNPYTLTTPNFVLPAAPQQLSYYFYLGSGGYQGTDPIGGSDPYPLIVQVSTDSGVTWTDIYDHSTANTTFASSSSVSNWAQNAISLAAYANQTIQIRFYSNSNYGGGFTNQGIDQFTISNLPTCFPPTAVNLTNITATSATINWTAPTQGTPAGYQWEVVASGAGPYATPIASNFFVGTQTTAATGSVLSAATTYDVYVKTGCSLTDTSTWSIGATFTTLCLNYTLPFVEGFNNTVIPTCWSQQYVNGTSNVNFLASMNNPTTTPQEGTDFVRWNAYSISAGNETRLVSPPITTTGSPSVNVSFYFLNDITAYTTGNYVNEGVTLQYSLDGTTWNDVQFYPRVDSSMTTSSTWNQKQILLPAAACNQPTVYLGFKFHSEFGNNVALDNLNVFTTPPCTGLASSLVASADTTYGFTASWTAASPVPANGYIWEVVPSGAGSGATPVATGTTASTVDSAIVTGISASTSYDFYVRGDCGSLSLGAWVGPLSVTTLCGNTSLPLVQGFNSGTIPACWSQQYVVGTDDLLYPATSTNPTTSPQEGSNYVNWNSYNFAAGDETRLVSPPIITTGVPNVDVSFYWFNDGVNYTTGNYLNEGVTVQYSTNGTTWTDVQFFPRVDLTVTTGTGWYQKTLTLPSGAGNQAAVYVGFKFHSEFGDNCSFDNLHIAVTPACAPPSGLTAGIVTNTGAIAYWNATTSGATGGYNWEVVAGGAGSSATPIASGTTAGGVDSAIITGLSSSTAYDFYVQSNCPNSTVSTWGGPLSFSTPCGAITAIPWTEGFEGLSTFGTGIFPPCWSSIYVAGGTFDNPGTDNGNTIGSTFGGPHGGSNFLYTKWDNTSWVYTPGFQLTGGTSYDFSFYMENKDVTSPVDFVMNVAVGQSATVAGMTDTLINGYIPTNTSYQRFLRSFIPPTTGVYYFGVNSSSVTSLPWYLSFDDFSLQLTPACAGYPDSLAVANVTNSGATATWTSASPAPNNGYHWEVVPAGAGPSATAAASDTTVAGMDTAHITGLTPNTAYDFYVQTNCGGATGVGSWSGPVTFQTPCINATLPIIQGFDTTIIPTCWSQEYVINNVNLQYVPNSTIPVTNPQQGTDFVWFNSAFNYGSETRLVSQPITTTGTPSVDMQFYWNNDNSTFANSGNYLLEGAMVQYSFDGVSWTDVQFFPRQDNSLPSGTNQWKKKTLTFPLAVGNQPVVYVGFKFHAEGGDNCSLDNINIFPSLPCAGGPTAVNISNVGTTTATISWTAAPSTPAGGYNWVVVASGDSANGTALASGTTAAGVTTATATGLIANTAYDVYVQSNCGGGNGVGYWVGPVSFSTACNAITSLPWTEGFEGLTTVGYDLLPSCWLGTPSHRWQSQNAPLTFPTMGARGGTNYLLDYYNANDTLFTPSFNLTGGQQYEFYFYYQTDGSAGWDSIFAMYGTSQAQSGMTTRVGPTVTQPVNTNYVKYSAIFTPATSGTYFMGVKLAQVTNFPYRIAFDDFGLQEVVPCPNPPLGGTISGPTSVCPNTAVNMSLTGYSPYTSLQWQTSIDSVNFIDIPTDTVDFYTDYINTVTYYRVKVKCADSSYSNIFGVHISPPTQCYCTANLGGFCGGNNIDTASIAGTNFFVNYTQCNQVNGSSYTKFPPVGDSTVTLQRGGAYTLFLHMTGTSISSAWIDYDQSGMFDANEWVQITTAATNGTAILNVPPTAALGQTGFRIRSRNQGNPNGSSDACSSFGSGETFDFLINIVDSNCNHTPTVLDTITNVSCHGLTNGAIALTLSGGIPPFTNHWSKGDTTASISNLSAGAYADTISFDYGCRYIYGPRTVSEPAALTAVTDSVSQVKCFGGSTGYVHIAVAGGTSPYTHHWNNGSTANPLSGVSVGSYTDSITDSHGCAVIVGPDTLTQPASAISISLDSTHAVKCNGGNNGAAYITASGGVGPYTYLWSNPGAATSPSVTSLTAGTYTIVVTDHNLCTASKSDSVSQPAALTVTTDSVVNTKCHTSSDGSVYIHVAGGTLPVTYAWTGGSNTLDLFFKPAGAYTVTVTDKNGCTTAATDTIKSPGALSLAASITNQIQGGAMGSVSLTVSGGTAAYKYHWNTGDSTSSINNLVAGVYLVTVTDQNGCTAAQRDTVSLITGIVEANGDIRNFNIFPNPSSGVFNVVLQLSHVLPVQIEVYSITGQLIPVSPVENSLNNTYQIDMTNEAEGVYFVKVKAGDVTLTRRITVVR